MGKTIGPGTGSGGRYTINDFIRDSATAVTRSSGRDKCNNPGHRGRREIPVRQHVYHFLNPQGAEHRFCQVCAVAYARYFIREQMHPAQTRVPNYEAVLPMFTIGKTRSDGTVQCTGLSHPGVRFIPAGHDVYHFPKPVGEHLFCHDCAIAAVIQLVAAMGLV